MSRTEKLTGICGGCGELWHGRKAAFDYGTYWALDHFLEDWELDGMIIAVARACNQTREAAVQTVGQAAQREGKSFEESLKAYFHLYTDGIIPRVEGYRGRVATRGAVQLVETEQPAPVEVKETLFEEVRPISGRVCSRGVQH